MKNFGLTTAEAKESRENFGSNALTEQAREGFWAKFFGNLKDPMIIILCVALIINIIFTVMGKTEWYESVGIAAAVLIATFVSTFSEYKNESAFKKLQEEASKINCKVYRDGAVKEISIDDIVTGDAVMLQAGDKIPADGVLADGGIKVEQSALNGEPAEVPKNAVPEEDLKNDFIDDTHNEISVFRGSVVASGNAVMIAKRVGDSTLLGAIAKEIQEDSDRDTPLKLKLTGLAKAISKFGYIGGGLIAVAFMIQRAIAADGFLAGGVFKLGNFFQDFINAVMLAVIIIVMAVPEGLPLMISLVSSLNMGKMLRDNVLVRKISGIETAGSINLLFSDKTGTITKGHLEAILYADGLGVETEKYDDLPDAQRRFMSYCINENTDAVISDGKVIGGNLTERAVLAYTGGRGSVGAKKLAVLPFNSSNKYSATSIEIKDGDGDFKGTVIKGAPERILPRCKYILKPDGSKMEAEGDWLIEAKIDALADRAIRVLMFAVSDMIMDPENPAISGADPGDDWTLVGILGIRDDVRPESITAIAEVQKAGIQVVMITGDRKETAVAIAKEAGLVKSEDDILLTSDEFNELSDDEVKEVLPRLRVIARALPHDKSRLVRISQSLNLVVGMTGDGVNDSPALKAADIGFAMGITGTEVAKEASEIIIMDDNFSSIDKAILYGRTIFNSIRKFIIFQLTINVSAVLISFIAPLIGLGEPLTITQILWINLIMDTLAAIAFGGEPALHRYMNDKPKRRDEPIVSRDMLSEIGTAGVVTFALALVYLLAPFVRDLFRPSVSYLSQNGVNITENFLYTGFFAFFVFTAVFNAFNARTERLNLFDNIGKNKGFLLVIGAIVVIQVALIYLGRGVFECWGLTGGEWAVVLAFAVLIIPVDLLRKAVVKIFAKKA
ncbi:MAG: calcium-translocating P-type ATPase, PMCA-type [Ruminococcus sp.]|jgi:calcium-translocating P-type ATPase|nr:calcium-translocating P-type ATPase, PMCA-type [Ruminococcus sp.]